MTDHDCLAEQFEVNRAHLRGIAYRMLGSAAEADDAVQEAWIRLYRADSSAVENLGGWLTTVVARVCLDMLRSRRSRREEPVGAPSDGLPGSSAGRPDPAEEALMADSVGPALLMVLDMLAPAERVAFVLHDVFAVPFDEIAPIVGRSPDAARQLASRARRRVRGSPEPPDADLTRQREVVDAFLVAARGGDFEALLAVLDPDVTLSADEAAVQMGTSRRLRGAHDVATRFSGGARVLRLALVDGAVGLVWAPGGKPRVVFRFTVEGDRIASIDQLADPGTIGQLDVAVIRD